MKGNQRLVLLLFLTFRVLRNPSREFWIATTLKLLKNLFRLWSIFSPNLRILSRKNNEPTPFIHFFGHDFCQERYRVIYLVVQAATIFVLLSTQALSPGPVLPTSIQSPALFHSEQFLAMTVTTNTSDRPNVSLVHVKKSIKKRFSFVKRKILLYRSTHA